MKFPKKAAVGALTGMLLLSTVSTSQAADTTPMASDPGPVGSFAWKGFNWEKRFWDGAPHFNKDYDAANVVNPDANGYVKLKITNPTGSAPVAAEFQSTRKGFGYGTYSTTVEKNVSALQKEVVWGCLFTYDPDAAPGYNEIDLCEASAWGGGAAYGQSWPVEQGHGYWFDATKAPGQGNNTTNFLAPSNPILTHKMVWEPGKITFETYAGEGYSGALLKRTVLEGATVPVPAKEQVHFNLWVTGGGGGNPQAVKAEDVTIRDFSFVPRATEMIIPPISVTAPAPSLTVTPTPTATATASPTPSPTAAPTASPTGTATASPSPTATVTATAPATTAPAPAPVVTAPLNSLIKVTTSSVKVKSFYNTTIKWSGAKGATVDVIVNGGKKTVPNNGTFVNSANKGATNTYQVCDSDGCSAKVVVKT